MTSYAEDLLRDELARQEAILDEVSKQEEAYIERGRLGEERVAEQKLIVTELQVAVSKVTAEHPFEALFGTTASTANEGDR